MAYLQQASRNQRAVTIGAVAALHAAVFYLVVTGLAVKIIRDPPAIFETWNEPIPKKVDPPPPKPDKAAAKDTKQWVETKTPLPPVPGDPFVPLEPPGTGPTGGETNAGGGVVELPLPPVPEPAPLFTAKGPKARGSQSNWVRQSDYPSLAIHQGHEGLTKVRLEVNALGRVTRCTITAGSGHDELDAAACAKLSDRARFDPASDTSGAKTEGTFSTSVRWQLPE
jgi:protein TonB